MTHTAAHVAALARKRKKSGEKPPKKIPANSRNSLDVAEIDDRMVV
jgi:hypothetical protein